MASAPSTMASSFSASINLIPPTTNPWIEKAGPLALYSPTLIIISSGLSQHAILFGFFFLLRGFSARRVFDTHYITFILALTLSFAGLVFLIDPALDNYKIFFLLEHEAVEVVLALRVLLPSRISKAHAGLILFLCWSGLSTVSIIVSLSNLYGHGADLVAWGAFCTDLFLGISGIKTIRTWYMVRHKLDSSSPMLRAKVRAEALAGVGFILHGFSTMCIGPIFVRVIYYNANPGWFAYGFAWVFAFAIFSVAFMVPVIAIFFSTINWCCWHNRKTLPGQAQWEDSDEELANLSEQVSERKQMLRGRPDLEV